MENLSTKNSLILGISIFLGLTVLGYILGSSAIDIKEYERTVSVKGLSERQFPADIVIWPIQFTSANNDLMRLYTSLEKDTKNIKSFLIKNGIKDEEITISAPAITDKLAQQYGNNANVGFRYTAIQSITVYSTQVEDIRKTINKLTGLGKKGIVFTGQNYSNEIQYIFTRLNDIKPEMIEEATTKAREVAEKFATDSNSKLGKIKNARQGQFSIQERDKNNPHIKKIRVVSTIEYYLSD